MKYLVLILLISNVAQAELIRGRVKVGEKYAEYIVETETGDYSLDIANLIEPQFKIIYTENKKPNCEGEENFAEVGGTDLPVSDYAFKRAQIDVEIKMIESIDEVDVSSQIKRDASSKGFQLRTLTNTTSYYVEDALLTFQWEPDSIVRKTKVPLKVSVETDINNQLSRAPSDNLKFKTKVHSFVCDLESNAVKISVNAKFGIYNRIQKAGALSVQQVRSLHQSLKKKENMYNLNTGDEDSLVKAIRASAVLALETKALGVPESFVTSEKYLLVFREMFIFSDYKVSALGAADYSSIVNRLSVDSEAQTEEVIQINQLLTNVTEK